MLISWPSSTSPVALSRATAKQLLGLSLSSKTKRSGVNRPLELTVAIKKELDQLGLPWIGVMFCMTTRGDSPMRAAISSAISELESPCWPLYSLGTIVLVQRAWAMRWAASKAAMPEKTPLLISAGAAFGAVICAGEAVARALELGAGSVMDNRSGGAGIGKAGLKRGRSIQHQSSRSRERERM